MAKCTKCERTDQEVEFYTHTLKQCKPCVLERNAAWRAKNPDYMKNYSRKRREDAPEAKRLQHLERRYGITKDDYYAMFNEQDGLCAICGETWDPLHVDHCHDTGLVRSLLCARCNQALGGFRDSPKLLLLGAKYLLRWGKFHDRPDGDDRLEDIIRKAFQ